MKKYRFLLYLSFMPLLNMAQSIAAGSHHTQFLCENGIPQSTGWNMFGVLGIGSDETLGSNIPVSVTGISDVVSIYAGENTSFFIDRFDRVWGCGQNYFGQLGDGTLINKTVPVLINLSDVIAISGSNSHTLFLKSDGTVWSTGGNNTGELGYATTGDRISTPRQIPTLSGIVAIATGTSHSLYLKNDGTVWASGLGSSGELANGSLASKTIPYQCAITNVVSISAGDSHSIFVKNDGTAYASGNNHYGALGDNTNTNRRIPTLVNGMTGIVKAIAHASSFGSYFLKDDQTVWACGLHFGSLIGTPYLSNVPVKIELDHIKEVAVGNSQAIFVTNDNRLWGSGNNGSGQLGLGNLGAARLPALLTACSSLATTAITEEEHHIFPNPVTDFISLSGNATITKAIIYDLNGKAVQTSTTQHTIDVSKLSEGFYCIEYTTVENKILRKKFIKR